MLEDEDINLELSKILAKTMQSSYKKKEIQETISRIMEKTELILNSNRNSDKIRELRKEFELIRKEYYGLK